MSFPNVYSPPIFVCTPNRKGKEETIIELIISVVFNINLIGIFLNRKIPTVLVAKRSHGKPSQVYSVLTEVLLTDFRSLLCLYIPRRV